MAPAYQTEFGDTVKEPTTFEEELGDDLTIPAGKMKPFYDKMRHTVVVISTDKVDKKDGKIISIIGSGMVVDTRGVVLTAHHVETGFNCASLLFSDKTSDLALIRRQAKRPLAGTTLDPGAFNYLIKLAPAKSLEVGMDVCAISHPRGRIYTFARGHLAFPANVTNDTNKGIACVEVTPIRRRAMDCRGEKDKELKSYPANLHLIQINNIHGAPGSSGGPVFNSAGLVIGMEVFINDNFDYCIHSSVLKGFIKNGLKHLDQPSGQDSKVLGESSSRGSTKRKRPVHRGGEGQGMRSAIMMPDVTKKQEYNDDRESLASKHFKLKRLILRDIKNFPISDFAERPGESDCPYYMKTQKCKFGLRCKFNHPKDKLNVSSGGEVVESINKAELPERPSKPICSLGVTSNTYAQRPGQTECDYYMKSGHCSFGERCKFHHPIDRTTPTVIAKYGPVPNVELTLAGLPRREGSVACRFYTETGVCKYGATAPTCTISSILLDLNIGGAHTESCGGAQHAP